MTNSERASYIRGLMEGLELDPSAKETKVLNAMLELLDDLCVSVEELEDGFEELSEQVDEIDEDLGDLEEEFYGLDDEDDCGCGHCHHDEGRGRVRGDLPQLRRHHPAHRRHAGRGSIVCPGCGETLEFDFDEEDEEEDKE